MLVEYGVLVRHVEVRPHVREDALSEGVHGLVLDLVFQIILGLLVQMLHGPLD